MSGEKKSLDEQCADAARIMRGRYASYKGALGDCAATTEALGEYIGALYFADEYEEVVKRGEEFEACCQDKVKPEILRSVATYRMLAAAKVARAQK